MFGLKRALDSVPHAINCALQAISFEDAIRSAVSIGGDSDTIAAIAGGIAEARFGLPEEIAAQAWTYLPEDMKNRRSQLLHRQELIFPRVWARPSIYIVDHPHGPHPPLT